jgi:predicted SnoaL-like aldol condensation-catalyzing enzyme
MNSLEHNKQTVIAFYTHAFNDKQPGDAVARYVGPEYIQHNLNKRDGAEAFIQNINGVIAKYPQLSVEIKRVIAEGDLVVTHDLVKTSAEGQARIFSSYVTARLWSIGTSGKPSRRRQRTTTPCSDSFLIQSEPRA